ncbi:hypothetical protein CIW48_25610 [Methylobacterium sp. P1-11]|uniref:NADH dehydrogenase ubiquinone Fe-S protein 4 n=1 Tax=Methylobacterium sp. P1-11 TaxID=2024616 RepID=UPI0011EDA78A|nr:NADH dehydrogenase ubiquinone Fe-S protein 4 [Methylobacterium sp. P1-11]KAA0121022.1 hypothetical protein CIW48_25610 [Methylobacterium sp. P1-11]
MQDGTIGLGYNNPPASAGAPWLDGRRALIRRRARSAGVSGRARAERWVLTFERETPAEIEPPMGRTGGAGPLTTEVALTFPTRAQAVAYAERQGLAYRITPDPAGRVRPSTLRVWRSNRDATPMQVRATAQDRSVDDPVPAFLPDLERALVNPAAVFATPAAVLDHPRLLPSCKREILRRWAWDEYLKEVAATEGMAEGEPSRLDAVKIALLVLGETWRPHPAAPAAAIPALQARERAA